MEQKKPKKTSLIVPILITIIGVAIYFFSKIMQNQAHITYLRAEVQDKFNQVNLITYSNTYGLYNILGNFAIVIGIAGLLWLIFSAIKNEKN